LTETDALTCGCRVFITGVRIITEVKIAPMTMKAATK